MDLKKIQKILVVSALLTFILSLAFAYMNTATVQGLYLSSNGFVDNKYFQQVSPVGTAFAIVWPIIYLWNLASLVYIFVSMFLKTTKSPVNIEPTLVPIPFLVGYILGFGTTVGWLFAFDREILELSLAFLILATGSLYFAIAVSYKRVYDNLTYLESRETKALLWLVRILIQNGLCLPATWLTIATFLNLVDVIIYEDSLGVNPPVQRGTISVEDASTVTLSILFATIVVWFILDNFVLEKYTRCTFTVFPVFILGFSGLVAKLRFIDANRNLILASVMLSFCVFALIFRVLFFIYRSKTRYRTIHTEQTDSIKTKPIELRSA